VAPSASASNAKRKRGDSLRAQSKKKRVVPSDNSDKDNDSEVDENGTGADEEMEENDDPLAQYEAMRGDVLRDRQVSLWFTLLVLHATDVLCL